MKVVREEMQALGIVSLGGDEKEKEMQGPGSKGECVICMDEKVIVPNCA